METKNDQQPPDPDDFLGLMKLLMERRATILGRLEKTPAGKPGDHETLGRLNARIARLAEKAIPELEQLREQSTRGRCLYCGAITKKAEALEHIAICEQHPLGPKSDPEGIGLEVVVLRKTADLLEAERNQDRKTNADLHRRVQQAEGLLAQVQGNNRTDLFRQNRDLRQNCEDWQRRLALVSSHCRIAERIIQSDPEKKSRWMAALAQEQDLQVELNHAQRRLEELQEENERLKLGLFEFVPGTKIPPSSIYDRWLAGEAMGSLAHDFEITPHDVERSLRYCASQGPVPAAVEEACKCNLTPPLHLSSVCDACLKKLSPMLWTLFISFEMPVRRMAGLAISEVLHMVHSWGAAADAARKNIEALPALAWGILRDDKFALVSQRDALAVLSQLQGLLKPQTVKEEAAPPSEAQEQDEIAEAEQHVASLKAQLAAAKEGPSWQYDSIHGNLESAQQELEELRKMQKEPEPFRGQPALALRKACPVWEHISDSSITFASDGTRWCWNDSPDLNLLPGIPADEEPVSGGWQVRPANNKTWREVEIAAAEMLGREDAAQQGSWKSPERFWSAIGSPDHDGKEAYAAYQAAFDAAIAAKTAGLDQQAMQQEEPAYVGLPPRALLKVCPIWEVRGEIDGDKRKDTLMVNGDKYTLSSWKSEEWQPLKGGLHRGWDGIEFRPISLPWAKVYIAAAEMLGFEHFHEGLAKCTWPFLFAQLGLSDDSDESIRSAYTASYDNEAAAARHLSPKGTP